MSCSGHFPLRDDSRHFESWQKNACSEEIREAETLMFWREVTENFIRISESRIDEALASIGSYSNQDVAAPQGPHESRDFIPFGDGHDLPSVHEVVRSLFPESAFEKKLIPFKMVYAKMAEQSHRKRQNDLRRRRESRWGSLTRELECLYAEANEQANSIRRTRVSLDSLNRDAITELARRLSEVPTIFRKPAFMILMFGRVREFGRTAYEITDKGLIRHLDIPMRQSLNKTRNIIFGFSWADSSKKIHRVVPSSSAEAKNPRTLLDCSWEEVEDHAIRGDSVARSLRQQIDDPDICSGTMKSWLDSNILSELRIQDNFWIPEKSVRGGKHYDSIRLARACFGRELTAPDLHALMTATTPAAEWKFGSPQPDSCSGISLVLRKVKQSDGDNVVDTAFTNPTLAVDRYLDLLGKV